MSRKKIPKLQDFQSAHFSIVGWLVGVQSIDSSVGWFDSDVGSFMVACRLIIIHKRDPTVVIIHMVDVPGWKEREHLQKDARGR